VARKRQIENNTSLHECNKIKKLQNKNDKTSSHITLLNAGFGKLQD
jgi:hypothetical protein